MEAWFNEHRLYRYGRINTDYEETGHYTQVSQLFNILQNGQKNNFLLFEACLGQILPDRMRIRLVR